MDASYQPTSGDQPKQSQQEQKVININYTSKPELYAAYMPFIKEGALFVRTNQQFKLGDEVFLILTLLQDAEKHTIPGRVVWKTPLGAQAGLRSGVGVQFLGEETHLIRKKINTHLAGLSNSDLRTDTL